MILRAWTFEGGTVQHLERVVRRDGALRRRTLPARCALIDHSTLGLVLFDTGYHPSLRTHLTGLPAVYHRIVPWRCPPEQATSARMAAIGLDARDVQHVVISHFHADHVAGLHDFSEARVHCSRTAWHHISTGRRRDLWRHGYFPRVLPDLDGRLELHDMPAPRDALRPSLAPFAEGMDLVALPGHAPGQLGLLLRRPGTDPALLVADATFSLDAVRTGALPSRIFQALAFDDTAETAHTLQRLQRWRRDTPGLRLIPAHAWELDDGVLFAPVG